MSSYNVNVCMNCSQNSRVELVFLIFWVMIFVFQAGSPWLQIVPWGMGKVLDRFKLLYNNPLIYITENGMFLTLRGGGP